VFALAKRPPPSPETTTLPLPGGRDPPALSRLDRPGRGRARPRRPRAVRFERAVPRVAHALRAGGGLRRGRRLLPHGGGRHLAAVWRPADDQVRVRRPEHGLLPHPLRDLLLG